METGIITPDNSKVLVVKLRRETSRVSHHIQMIILVKMLGQLFEVSMLSLQKITQKLLWFWFPDEIFFDIFFVTVQEHFVYRGRGTKFDCNTEFTLDSNILVT